MANQGWMCSTNKSPPRNPDTHNSNFVILFKCPTHKDIFPFFNFSNHGQHGVDIEKYIQAWPEDEREKVLQEHREKVEKLKLEIEESKHREAEESEEDTDSKGNNVQIR